MPITVDGKSYADVAAWNNAMDAQATQTAPAMLAALPGAAPAPTSLAVSPDLQGSPFAAPSAAGERQPYLQEKPSAGAPLTAPAAPVATTGRDPLDMIEHFESGGRNVMQGVVPPGGGYNPSVGHTTGPSTASGYWQITNSTWRGAAPKVGVDISQYPTAMSAPREVQRAVAEQLYKDHGYAPWAPFNPKLAQAVGWKGLSAGGALPYAKGGTGSLDAAMAPMQLAAAEPVDPTQSLNRVRPAQDLNIGISAPSAGTPFQDMVKRGGGAPIPLVPGPGRGGALQPTPLAPVPNIYKGYQDALAAILSGQRRGFGSIFG